MADNRTPRWLVCEGCRTYRRTKYAQGLPADARLIDNGVVHDAGTHELYSRDAYRLVAGPGSREPGEDVKRPEDVGLVLHDGVWSTSDDVDTRPLWSRR